MVQIELFTANLCKRCVQAKSVLTELVEELGYDQFNVTFVDVVENLDHAVATGVLATPALVVNGQLVFSPLPDRGRIFQFLKAKLQE